MALLLFLLLCNLSNDVPAGDSRYRERLIRIRRGGLKGSEAISACFGTHLRIVRKPPIIEQSMIESKDVEYAS